MTNAIDELKRRVGASTNPKAIEEAEAQKDAQSAEFFKDKARERELSRWTERSRKPMRVFEADVTEGDIIDRSGVRQDGSEYEARALQFTLANVKCTDGSPVTTIEFRMPEPGKDWSKHSEAAITVRESGGQLARIEELLGGRWRFEGDWMPTFLKNRFWEGTYYYRVTSLVKAQAKPDAANVAVVAASLYGQPVTAADAGPLLKWLTTSGIKDGPLQKLVVDGKFVAYAEAEGLLASAEGVFYDPTANSQ